MDEEQNDADKQYDATEAKRQRAREQGRIPRSQDLTAAGHLLALAFGLSMFGQSVIEAMAVYLKSRLERPPELAIDRAFFLREFGAALWHFSTSLAPWLALVMAAALAVSFVQLGGWMWVPELLAPKWSHLNPIEGAKKLVSAQAWIRLLASVAKLAALAFIAVWFTTGELPLFLPATGAEPAGLLMQIQKSLITLAMLLAGALLSLGLLDFTWQKWKHEQDLKMTRQELRDEMKQTEGDPQTAQRRKEAHAKLVQSKAVSRTREADAVITNPLEIAIAIKYDPEKMPAPIVVAKGKGEIAAQIRRIAVEHGIPIIERRPLAQALYKMVKVGQAIPVEMYEVFLEIMKYVYDVTGRTPQALLRARGTGRP
jgi:flagellar biosynthesis protein FlhB